MSYWDASDSPHVDCKWSQEKLLLPVGFCRDTVSCFERRPNVVLSCDHENMVYTQPKYEVTQSLWQCKTHEKVKKLKKTNLLDTNWTQHWSTLEVACAQLGRSFHWNRSTLTTQCTVNFANLPNLRFTIRKTHAHIVNLRFYCFTGRSSGTIQFTILRFYRFTGLSKRRASAPRLARPRGLILHREFPGVWKYC